MTERLGAFSVSSMGSIHLCVLASTLRESCHILLIMEPHLHSIRAVCFVFLQITSFVFVSFGISFADECIVMRRILSKKSCTTLGAEGVPDC